jgi:hypothetical protein
VEWSLPCKASATNPLTLLLLLLPAAHFPPNPCQIRWGMHPRQAAIFIR